MSKKVSPDLSDQQLQQEIQNELLGTNELLHSITEEIRKIKTLTSPHGELATNVEKNSEELGSLARSLDMSIGNTSPPKQTDPEEKEPMELNN